jgi:hypothetical protein
MSHPVFIRRIQHLTDARYFAAMGVDWMSMELTKDQVSFDRWHARKDWVSGVKLAAEVDIQDEELLAKVIIEAKPDGIVVSEPLQVELPKEITVFHVMESVSGILLPDDGLLILNYDPFMTRIQSMLGYDQKKIFLQADWTPQLIEDVMQLDFHGGFCFLGSGEETVGVKDYSEMDEMLERIRG